MNAAPVTAEDLNLYALGLLESAEAARIDNFLLQSPDARQELASIRGDMALFAMTAEAHTPPAMTRQRLMKQIARERRTSTSSSQVASTAYGARQNAFGNVTQDGPMAASRLHPVAGSGSYAARQQTPLPELMLTDTATYEAAQPLAPADFSFRTYDDDAPERSNGFMGAVLPWAGWAIAAGLAVSTFFYAHRTESMHDEVAYAKASAARAAITSAKAEAVMDTMRSGASQRFMLTKANTAPITAARVTYLAESGSLVFQGSNLEALPPYKTYELWLIPISQGRQPIPAGTFKPDERGFATIVLPDLPKGVVAGTFGVTMEDEGGSQAPTLPILMIGS